MILEIFGCKIQQLYQIIMTTPVKKVPIHLQSAQNRLIIKNGDVVNEDGIEQVDIYIEDCIIKQVGNHLIIPGGTRVIDATGKLVLPGGIDSSVHLQTPAQTSKDATETVTIDNFYQGTKAAIAGGTTTIIDRIIPGDEETLEEAYAKFRGWAEDKACCDYAFTMSLPKFDDSIAMDMELLTSQDFGINTFHLNMSGKRQMDDVSLSKAFMKCNQIGCLAQVHAECGALIDRNVKKMLERGITGPEGYASAHSESAEEEAVMRSTTLANQVHCPLYITHVTSKSAKDVIEYKKSKGAVIVAEITPAALACDGEEYWNTCWRHAAGFMCEPPLRKGQKDELLAGLTGDNCGFDLIASDHATFNGSQKALGLHNFTKVPLGVNGVESRMSVLWELAVHSGLITPERFVALTSATPAKLFNLYPDKGHIAVGANADVVIWDPKATRKISKEDHNLKVDFNVFEGMECHGVADTVIVQGKVMVDEGRVRVMQGFGRFIPLSPFAPSIFEKVRSRQEESISLSVVQPVIRSDADMEIAKPASTNGTHSSETDDIPSPERKKSEQPERAPSQQNSSIDMRDHPNSEPHPIDSPARNSPKRASIRVRAPPGGTSSGGFW